MAFGEDAVVSEFISWWMLSEVRLSADVNNCEIVSGGTDDSFSAKALIK